MTLFVSCLSRVDILLPVFIRNTTLLLASTSHFRFFHKSLGSIASTLLIIDNHFFTLLSFEWTFTPILWTSHCDVAFFCLTWKIFLIWHVLTIEPSCIVALWSEPISTLIIYLKPISSITILFVSSKINSGTSVTSWLN